MIARLALIAALSALPLVAVAQTTPGATVEALHRAIAGSDRATAARVLAADVQIFESGYVERSRDEYLSHHFAADAGFARSVVRKVTKHSEQVTGNMALVLDETETSGSYEGRPVALVGTETVVLQREGDAWRIVHIHWSSRKAKP